MVVAFLAVIGTGTLNVGLASCQGGLTYLLEADSGGNYALVGIPSGLRSEYANHTTRISVNGTYSPSNLAQLTHPDPNFRGVIYVNQYIINGETFNFAETVVMVSGTVTRTSTNTKQIGPTTMTVVTELVTLTPISLSGVLDYEEYCVTPLLTTPSSTSLAGNFTQPIPGFTALSILVGFILGISILGLLRNVENKNSR
jgi:hypothetical protein